MKTFIEWCEHYEYNPESPEAAADYRLYVEQLNLFQSLPEEPCFLDDDQPLEPPPFATTLNTRDKAPAGLHTRPHPSGRGKGR
ncbi:TPA: hypothetical protein RN854_004774 [Escherichia coli]|nr:hypothetical protein [Escherichia coli]